MDHTCVGITSSIQWGLSAAKSGILGLCQRNGFQDSIQREVEAWFVRAGRGVIRLRNGTRAVE